MIAFDHTADLTPGIHGSDRQVDLLASWAR
jgi:hypothetical protein